MTGKSPQLDFSPYITLETKNSSKPNFRRFPTSEFESELARSEFEVVYFYFTYEHILKH